MVPVRVHGVALLPPDETPVMLLREITGERRWLPIAIGAPEATALVAACQQVVHSRPDTIELIGQVIEVFGHVERVEVTALDSGVFFSDLVLGDGVRVSARPSDAVAIGVRAGVPLEVDEAVLAVASTTFELADDDVEQQIADFRVELDYVSPEDFGDPPTG
ncbi:bifunctional nuclease family protein [Amycolatopsis magusensis]|uniref:Bifunctional DNase/RNase n=1 Tax=Amycolatopsis magusensis TaxID=882444 RepID=A0ABS4PRW3_9PSEU|nr:bifunctional nuclease family protein [Amycolatopsis magusensis]MBP2182164.1 bifunctional DNase/RNase [Amycolatopsis magusensis]MDI5974575.1 bifunctional nuclease family protein [Amycolatopsis magusensis]